MKNFNNSELGFFYGEDKSCDVKCDCGQMFLIYGDRMNRCPNCGKGYKTEFVVWQYEKDEEAS